MAVGVVTNFYDGILFHDIQFSALLSFIAREGREKNGITRSVLFQCCFRVIWDGFPCSPALRTGPASRLPPQLSAQVLEEEEEEEEELYQEAARMLES